jgi:hypothetical protein
MKRILWTMVLLVAGSFGCGGSSDTSEVDDPIGGKEDSLLKPVGAFFKEDPNAGEFMVLVLRSDYTFHREKQIHCVKAPCDPLVTDGKYKFTKSRGVTYVRFLDQDGKLIDRYRWTYTDNKLEIGQTADEVFTMVRNTIDGWCQAAEECAKINLVFSGGDNSLTFYRCENNQCSIPPLPQAVEPFIKTLWTEKSAANKLRVFGAVMFACPPDTSDLAHSEVIFLGNKGFLSLYDINPNRSCESTSATKSVLLLAEIEASSPESLTINVNKQIATFKPDSATPPEGALPVQRTWRLDVRSVRTEEISGWIHVFATVQYSYECLLPTKPEDLFLSSLSEEPSGQKTTVSMVAEQRNVNWTCYREDDPILVIMKELDVYQVASSPKLSKALFTVNGM